MNSIYGVSTVTRFTLLVLFLSIIGFVLLDRDRVFASKVAGQKEICNYLEEAARAGDSFSEHSYGDCFRTGYGRQQNIELAEAWYKKAIEGGVLPARISLASLYLFYFQDEQKKHLAIDLLREPVQEGYAKAIFVMGIAFHNGFGVSLNNSKALQYYRDAATKGHSLSATVCYLISKDNLYHLEGAELYTDYCMELVKRISLATDPEAIEKIMYSASEDKFVKQYILNMETR